MRIVRVEPKKNQWSSKATATALVVIACAFLPDLANLHPNDDSAWIIYLTAKEASRAVLCLLVAWYSPGRFLRRMATGCSLLFFALAVNEGMNDNLFGNTLWQYPVACVYLLLIWFFAKRYQGDDDQG